MGVEDDKGKATVLAVLTHKSLNMVDFKLKKRHISPALYQKVAKAISDGKITVLVGADMLPAGIAGRYFPELKFPNGNEWYDLLVLRTSSLGSTAAEKLTTAQLIVHECTHAGFDLLKTAKMTHLEHEAAAYIAGARYLVETMMELGGHPERVTFTEKIETAAWKIALLQADGEEVPTQAYTDLDVAIMTHPAYKAEAKKIAVNDGVGKKWKTP